MSTNTPNTEPHTGIRIGTLVQGGHDDPAAYIREILPHGFESFSITFWKCVPEGLDLSELAMRVNDVIETHAADTGHRAVVSSLGMFGNPLTDGTTAEHWKKCIDACAAFDCDIVAGFAGALPGETVDKCMGRFGEVFRPIADHAASQGVRLAFENCDMGGTWKDSGDYNIAHAPAAWEMMFNEVPGEHVGLEWEPCHQMYSLIDPIPQLKKWAGKVVHVHGKDATVHWDVIREHGIRGPRTIVHHRTPGFGDTNWSDVITILRQSGYTGSIDIEGWHDPVYRDDLEMTGQVHALNYLKRCRGGTFVPNPA